MLLRVINALKVSVIKDILLNTGLSEPIIVESEHLFLKLFGDGVSETEESSHFYDMDEVYLLNADSSDVLFIHDRSYSFFFNVGHWRPGARIPGAHVCLGTDPITFNSNYFAQVELSQALEDDSTVYIVKNLSKLAGEGAMSRLNKGAENQVQKRKRREILKQFLGFQTLIYDKHEWLCLCRFTMAEMEDETRHPELLHRFIFSLLKYAVTVEEIITTDVDIN